MTVRMSTSSWGSSIGTSWSRRVAVLVTAAATALGVAVVVSPAADAARPVPTSALKILQALDNGTTLPQASPDDVVVGFVKPGEDFTLSVQSLVNDGTGTELPVNKDTDVTVTAGSTSWTVTIPDGESIGTLTTARWGSTANFVATASLKGYASDSLPVTVALNSKNDPAPADGSFLGLDDCVLSKDNPTCVRLSVPGGTGGDVTLLSTSECANFLGGTGTGLSCRKGKGSDPAVALVAQTFVDLADEQVATIILDCDKSLCGNGGVASFVPLFDKGNTGAFERLEECPAKNTLGSLGACFDKAQSTRDNAGDLHSYILFDDDARSLH